MINGASSQTICEVTAAPALLTLSSRARRGAAKMALGIGHHQL